MWVRTKKNPKSFRKSFSLLLCGFLTIGFLGAVHPIANNDFRERSELPHEPILRAGSSHKFSGFGDHFTENMGQIDNPNVFFYLSGSIGFTKNSIIINMREYEDTASDARERYRPELEHNIDRQVKGHVFKLQFDNANDVIPVGVDELPHRSNYFIGNDPAKWRTNVPNYRAVMYYNIYDGIDFIYRMKEGVLKYDFIVQPNADPSKILLKYEGIEGLALRSDESLLITTPLREVRDSKPYIYQEVGGTEVGISGGFKILGERSVAFDIDQNYDRNLPLIIDPGLEWSTYLGADSDDRGYAIAADPDGNTYITGLTFSSNFPVTPGAYDTTPNGVEPSNHDTFIAKFNSTGTALIYSTFIGGSESELGWDIALDSERNAYVTGETYSLDFPTTPGAYQTSPPTIFNPYNAFVVKLNSTGSALVYSTFIGGTEGDYGIGIAVDADENAYITGYTNSLDFPTTPGAYNTSYNNSLYYEAFVTKLNNTGSALVYSTFLGGCFLDTGVGIAVDSSGNAYIAGYTQSSDFPTTPGAYDTSKNGGTTEDAFVTKLNSTGSALVYSTFLGGSTYDRGYDIALDASGSAYVTGWTESSDFPTSPDAHDKWYSGNFDVFATKLNSTGTTLVYSTFIGGTGHEWANGIATDFLGNAYITGVTMSSSFPTTPGAYDTSFNGGYDAFVTKVNSTGTALVYSTFIGSTGDDSSGGGFGIAVDLTGNVSITGATGFSISQPFPTTPGAYDTSFNGFFDAFVAKFSIAPKVPDYVPWNPVPVSQQKVEVDGLVSISTYVKNIGAENAVNQSIIAFYNLSTPTQSFRNDTVPALNSKEVSATPYTAIWHAPSTPGTYYVVVEVDHDDNILESDETNNVHVIEIIVGVPDYVPWDPLPSSPQYVTIGSSNPISGQVKNVGSFNATVQSTIAFYNQTSPSELLKTYDVPALTKGMASSTYSTTWTAPLISGTYYVVVKVDYDDNITETDETNNTYVFEFIVGAPDYIPWEPLPTSSREVTTDSLNVISAYVKNIGTGNANGQSVIAFYNESTQAQPFKTGTVQSLVMNEVSANNYTATWLAPSTPGTYYVVIKVDYGNDIAELNETNNTLTIELHVTAKPVTQTVLNYKPMIALVFSIILLLVGSYVSYKRPLRLKEDYDKNKIYTWMIFVLPFVIAEISTGIISYLTGLLSVPPLLDAGMVVDLVILIMGLITFILVFWKSGDKGQREPI